MELIEAVYKLEKTITEGFDKTREIIGKIELHTENIFLEISEINKIIQQKFCL